MTKPEPEAPKSLLSTFTKTVADFKCSKRATGIDPVLSPVTGEGASRLGSDRSVCFGDGSEGDEGAGCEGTSSRVAGRGGEISCFVGGDGLTSCRTSCVAGNSPRGSRIGSTND